MQLELHPIPPSSHVSDPTFIESPQIGLHIVGFPVQFQPVLFPLQVGLHPPIPPSSHVSEPT